MASSYKGFYIGQIVQFSSWERFHESIQYTQIYKVIDLDPIGHPEEVHIQNTKFDADHNFVPMKYCRPHPQYSFIEDGDIIYG